MRNENTSKTNYKIATLDDINEIKEVIEYVRGLVIKSQDVADANETITSLREGTTYVSAVYNLNDTDDMNRRVIIDSYVEKNPYYKMLYNDYNIPYAEARIANDLKILKSMNNILSSKDEALFQSCYTETVDYCRQTFYTKAFENQQYNRQYLVLNLLMMTIQKYLTRKLEYFFDIDNYSEKDLKNSFISYGFDYFDGLPLNYQRRILKLLNDLVISKGTNHVMRKILDIFGNTHIDIYKYILAKLYNTKSDGTYDFDNPNLIFYKTLADGLIDYENDLVIGYDQMTENDPFWKVDKEELLFNRVYNKQTEKYERKDAKFFNTITSKYMSIDVTMDLLANTMKLSNLYNLIYKMEMEYKDKKDINNFGFYNRDMSSTQIGLFEGILGLTSLILRSQGLTDYVRYFLNMNQVNAFNKNYQKENDWTINNLKLLIEQYTQQVKNKSFTLPSSYKKYNNEYGFSIKNKETFRLYNKFKTDGRNTTYGIDNLENNNDIQEFLDKIQILLLQNKKRLTKEKKFTKLYRFFRNFNMYNFSTPLDKNNMSQLYSMVSQSSSLSHILNNGLKIWSDDIPLVEYLADENHDIIDKLNYIRQHIILGKCNAKYITQYSSFKELFTKYIYLEGYRNPETRTIENNYIILNDSLLRKDIEKFLDIVDSGQNTIYLSEIYPNDKFNIRGYYKKNDMVGMFMQIMEYTLEHRKFISERLNIKDEDKLNDFLYSDRADVTFYSELYAIMQLFYLPFKDDESKYIEKKYNISEFMDIFNANEALREELINFILETNDYKLYRLYNAIFYSKFVTIRNTWGNNILTSKLLNPECYDLIRKIFKQTYPDCNVDELDKRDLINFIFDFNNVKFINKDMQPYFMGAIDEVTDYNEDMTFSDLVKGYNSEFYNWLFIDRVALKDLSDKEVKELYRNKIFTLSECLDNAMNTNVFSNYPFSGTLDFIIEILYLICTIFKSFTIDLIQSDTVLRMTGNADKAFNTLKLFDEMEVFQINEDEGYFKEQLKLIDVMSDTIIIDLEENVANDNLNLHDVVSIKIIDE